MTDAADNADYLLREAHAAGITDRRELAIFMGQMQVESGGFRSMHEGLNYRPERLLAVFGPYTDRKGVWHDGRNGLTTLDEARAITARGPRGVAEAIYGGRWGARNLGNLEPGDGWKYHGRGYVQLTGRDNYERVGQALNLDLLNDADLAADRAIAARIAIHYWQDRVRANGHQLSVEEATHDINGGKNHLPERRRAAESWGRKFEQGYLDRVAPAKAPVRASGAAPATRTGEVPGFAGTAVIDQEAHQRAGRALLSHPSHPQHALFTQVLEKVRAEERAKGIVSGPHGMRVAGALVVECVREGITRVDRVELNREGTLVRGVQVSPLRDEPGLNMTTGAISTLQASQQTLAGSSEQAHQVAINVQAQQQDAQRRQTQRVHATAL